MDTKKKSPTKATLIIYYLCAIIWSISLILDIVNSQEEPIVLILHIFCAVVWTFCAVIWTIRYRKEKKESNTSP